MMNVQLGGGKDGVYTSRVYKSPARAAVFGADALHFQGTVPVLDVLVDHKNTEETEWHTLTFPEICGPGTFVMNLPELREEYRWRIKLRETADACIRMPWLWMLPIPDDFSHDTTNLSPNEGSEGNRS